MKIYTKTGDKGTTALIGGTRVPKHDLRIEAYGTIDELNSFIGLLRDKIENSEEKNFLINIQNELFNLGAFLALDPAKKKLANGKNRMSIPPISDKIINKLESRIDLINEQLPPMTHFILPGGHETVSICHICRTIARRAERKTTALGEISEVEENWIKYLNRLSDYLFILARKLSKDLEIDEIKWQSK
jgi:cob(I)alamin adenosyltransferase